LLLTPNPAATTGADWPRPHCRGLAEQIARKLPDLRVSQGQRRQHRRSRPAQVAVADVWCSAAIPLLSGTGPADRQPPAWRWVAAADSLPAPQGYKVGEAVPSSARVTERAPRPRARVSGLLFPALRFNGVAGCSFPKRPTGPPFQAAANRRPLRLRPPLADAVVSWRGVSQPHRAARLTGIVEGWGLGRFLLDGV